MTTSTENNPLLNQDRIPSFDKIKPEHVGPAVNSVCSSVREKISNLEISYTPTWEGLIEPLSECDLSLHKVWAPVSHLNSVANSEDLRKAYQDSLGNIIKISLEMSQNPKLYKGLTELKESDKWSKLDGPQKRIVDAKILDAKLAGIGLEANNQERFNHLTERISKIQTEFSNNVLDATKEYSLLLTDPKDIDGLTDSYLELASQSYNEKYKEKGEKSTAQKGPWLVTLDSPSLIPFLENSKQRNLREEIYRVYIKRASEGKFNNTEIINEILRIRKEQAKILGFSSFAQLSLQKKMASSVEDIYQLEEELREPSWKAGHKELDELQKYAISQGFTGELKHWDIAYWAKRLQEEKFDYTEEELKPYFSLPSVLRGLFSLVENIFRIKVELSSVQSPVWHEDVHYYDIKDESGEYLASFYLDPYSRPSNKRGGAWMDECITRHKNSSGVVRPIAHLVCNFTPPVGNKPSLLTFREVETIFHEFGHGLQHMLTEIDYLDASGINGVEWDAVELPSQFMENWCYHKKTLLGLAKHVETGHTMPEDLYQKIVASRTYRAGSNMLRQIQFGLIDLKLHDSFDPDRDQTTVFDVQKDVCKNTSILPPLEEDRFLCSFSHIFAVGYAAGYYSYKWAEVLSADAFSAFEDAGVDNDQAVREVGYKFRKTILAKGGGQPPLEVFREYRGRDPQTGPLLRHYGLSERH